MKYLASIPIILLFAILDLIIICTIFLVVVVMEEDYWPMSYRFAEKVWNGQR